MPYPPIKKKKTANDLGRWSTGRVPRSDFPMPGHFPIKAHQKWRCMRLVDDDSRDLRLLIVVSERRNEFQALLAEVADGKSYVLACLEEHASHSGLHCHAPCGRELPIYSGSLRYPDMRVAPNPGSSACRRSYTWTQDAAYREALRFFNVNDKPKGALV